jgi:hypothetical protein
MLLEFEGAHQEEEQEQPEEPEVSVSEESVVEELPECPDHRPSSFLKGKSRCMLTQSSFTCVDALSGRNWLKILAAYILPYLEIIMQILFIVRESGICIAWLRTVEVGWFTVIHEL